MGVHTSIYSNANCVQNYPIDKLKLEIRMLKSHGATFNKKISVAYLEELLIFSIYSLKFYYSDIVDDKLHNGTWSSIVRCRDMWRKAEQGQSKIFPWEKFCKPSNPYLMTPAHEPVCMHDSRKRTLKIGYFYISLERELIGIGYNVYLKPPT